MENSSVAAQHLVKTNTAFQNNYDKQIDLCHSEAMLSFRRIKKLRFCAPSLALNSLSIFLRLKWLLSEKGLLDRSDYSSQSQQIETTQ